MLSLAIFQVSSGYPHTSHASIVGSIKIIDFYECLNILLLFRGDVQNIYKSLWQRLGLIECNL